MNNNILKSINEVMQNNNDKEITLDLHKDLSTKDILLLSSINKLKNPFEMIGTEYIMKDLNICRGVVYKLFQRPDFPTLNIGKAKQVMLISYIIWKMDRKDW